MQQSTMTRRAPRVAAQAVFKKKAAAPKRAAPPAKRSPAKRSSGGDDALWLPNTTR